MKNKGFISLTACMLAFLMLSFPVIALGMDESASSAFVPDTSGGYYEEFTDPTLSDDDVIGGVIGGGQIELQDYTVITSSVVPDGVYAIENLGNANRWMDLQYNQLEPGARIQQYAYASSPAESFSRAGLFKISKSAVTGYYIIRLMMNNLLTFDFDGTAVKTKTIPANDADVPYASQFAIEKHASGGYTLRPLGGNTSYVVAANNTTASGSAGAPNSYLIQSTVSSSGAQARWELQQYTGSAQSGVSAGSDPSIGNGITVGSTSTLSLYAWSTVIGVNHAVAEVASAYSDKVTLTQTSYASGNNVKYSLAADRVGRFILYYRIKNASSGVTTASYSGTYFVTPDLANGTYYIQNGATGRYMDVEGPSAAEGAYIQQWSFSTSAQKRWTLTSAGGGYYTIKSEYSGKYVGIDSSAVSQVKQYTAVNDYTKWYFEKTESGRYALHNKARGTAYALASPSDTSANGVDLTMSGYTNDTSYRDEWLICSRVMSIVNYYDESVATHTTYSQYIPLIENSVKYVNDLFGIQFHVGFYMDGAATFKTDAVANGCPNNGSACTDATCGLYCYGDHHKNVSNISEQLYYGPREDDHIYVMWSYATYFCIDSHSPGIAANGHTQFIANGLVLGFRPVVHIMNPAKYSSNLEHNMANDLAHEIMHTFGFPERYTENEHQKYNTSCIMGQLAANLSQTHYNSVINNSDTAFCVECKKLMETTNYFSKAFPGNQND
ncbi:MAG: RICIN domain-containing protein [Clostridia bacterium]|nr:RICIN domain-containing protein [Clostridia bacterium]